MEDFGQRLPYLMRRVNAALSHRLDRTLRKYSLTQAQLSALALLGLEHPERLSGAELSHRSGVTAQSMSTAISGLVERGLVDRTPHPTHGRIIDVHITDLGLEVLRQVQTATKAVEDQNMGGLDEQQQAQLRALLRQMMRALDLYLPGDDDPTRAARPRPGHDDRQDGRPGHPRSD